MPPNFRFWQVCNGDIRDVEVRDRGDGGRDGWEAGRDRHIPDGAVVSALASINLIAKDSSGIQ